MNGRPHPLWEPIHKDTTPLELVGTTVLSYREDPRRGVVAAFRKDEHGNIIMQFARTPTSILREF